MPPKYKFTREEIISAALAITRESGIDALSARSLAARLGTSTKPIFGVFDRMTEVRAEVEQAASALYRSYLEEDTARGAYPPFKAIGMGYIRFAKEEPLLFRLLFMCDRSSGFDSSDPEELPPVLALLQKSLDLSAEDARLFHLEMWVTVHGIAAMVATSYFPWDEETISTVITDLFEGLKSRFTERRRLKA